MRDASCRLGNDPTEDVADQRGGPGQRLVQREEGDPFGLAAHLGQERTTEYLQDDDGEGEGPGGEHGDER